jgi:hypothetical protein
MWKTPRDAELVGYFRRTLTEAVVKRTRVPAINQENADTPRAGVVEEWVLMCVPGGLAVRRSVTSW